MDPVYRRFLRQNLDLSAVGLARREDNSPYFCTPKGASVIGWAGVDGIHFCFVRGFGLTVFAVSPMSGGADCVHPLARNFEDFLRLLLACGDTAALEQAHAWDAAQFSAFLRDCPPTPEGRQALAALARAMDLTPMEQPFDYLRAVQGEIDLSRLRFSDAYHEAAGTAPVEPEAWKVYFTGGFFGPGGRERAGTEVPLHRQFDWAGRRWTVPAVYLCARGIVADICLRADPEPLRAFLKTWEKDLPETFSPELQMKIDAENPLSFDFRPQLTADGRKLAFSHSCGVCYNPFLPEQDPAAARIAAHYGLDPDCGWMICRASFPWPGKRPRAVTELRLTMTQEPLRLPGPHFTVRRAGETVPFSLPGGQTCVLTVRALTPQTLPAASLGADRFYPTRFTVLEYTLSPEPAEPVTVRDCTRSDPPRLVRTEDGQEAPGVAIIGGADGPIAYVMETPPRAGERAACSALHFEAPEEIEWRLEFRRNAAGTESFPLTF